MRYYHMLLSIAAICCAAIWSGAMAPPVSAQEYAVGYAVSESAAVATATTLTMEVSASPVTEFWEQDDSGIWRYYDAQGIVATGEVTINGQAYAFAPDGTLYTGWQTVDGVRRYYDPLTGKARTGWIYYQQAYYYVDPESGKCTGTQYGLPTLTGEPTASSEKFLLDSYGALQLGYFTHEDGSRYYADETTGVIVTGELELGSDTYYFDTDGRQLTGWIVIDSNRCYFDTTTGKKRTGLVRIEGNTYYLTADSGMQTGLQKIAGTLYYFQKDGTLLTNSDISIDGVTYHADATGVLKEVPKEPEITKDEKGRTSIIASSQATVAQMTAYIRSVNPNVAQSVINMIPYYLSEGEKEGVRGDIAFAQSCLETGNFTFQGSAVSLDQNNFCGMGVTQNGEKGNSFATPQIGIRAQIQHLKAYASTDALAQECVDPRFRYVHRGCAPYVQWLGIQENPQGYGWAAGANYGDKILKILLTILKM